MNPPRVLSNERPTLGVEVELQLVNARTMALRGVIAEVLDALPAELHASVKPELLQCCLPAVWPRLRKLQVFHDFGNSDHEVPWAAMAAFARSAADIPGSLLSSCGLGVVAPGGVLAVAGSRFEAAVQDADEAVGELAQRGLVADVAVAQLLVVRLGSG